MEIKDMASFRKEILGQIERIDAGRIFTFRDLSFDAEKTANVAVLLLMLRCCSPNRAAKGYWCGLKKVRTTVPKNLCWGWESCLSIKMNSSVT